MTARRSNDRVVEDDDDLRDFGVFAFARKSAQLLIPMSLVAAVFGLWLRSELLAVRQDFARSIVQETQAVRNDMVTRTEFVLLRQLMDERWATDQKSTEEQNRMIQRNTVYLERIGQKLGIQRPPE